jgi:transcriptional regulator with XRE-family HTH domain
VRRPPAEIKGTGKKAPDRVDSQVGRNIRLQRFAKRMSQGELARRLGITSQQVQKYERGANRVTASRLVRLARIFDVPLTTLFAGVKGLPARSGSPPAHLITDYRSFRLLQAYAQINDTGLRGALVDLVEDIVRLRPKRLGSS